MTLDEEEFEGAIVLEPQEIFNSAITGFTLNSNSERILCYDYDLLIEAYIDNMPEEDKVDKSTSELYSEANDYISYTTIRSIDYLSSDRKPIIIYSIDI